MRKTLMIFLVMLMSAGAYADMTYELRGSVREWLKVFASDPNPLSLLETRVKLELLSTLGENTAFKAETYLVYEPINGQALDIDMQEVYIDFYSERIDMRVGKQVIAWGKADELNPTDIINPEEIVNITEEKNIRKKGLTAVKADVKFEDLVFTGICIADFAIHDFPPPGSSWDFFSGQMQQALAAMGITYTPEVIPPENRLDSLQWAFKLSKTMEMLDFSFSYANVWDNLFTPYMASPGEMYFVFYRTQMFALDFAASLFDFGLWFEGAYFYTRDPGGTDDFIKNPYIQYVVGMDYTLPWDLKVNVQFFHEIITMIDSEAERQVEEANISRLGLSLPVQRALSFRIGKNFGEADANSFEIFGIVDLKDGGIMMGPKMVITPEDAVKVEFGVQIFDGRQESIFNLFNLNDEYFVKATYSF